MIIFRIEIRFLCSCCGISRHNWAQSPSPVRLVWYSLLVLIRPAGSSGSHGLRALRGRLGADSGAAVLVFKDAFNRPGSCHAPRRPQSASVRTDQPIHPGPPGPTSSSPSPSPGTGIGPNKRVRSLRRTQWTRQLKTHSHTLTHSNTLYTPSRTVHTHTHSPSLYFCRQHSGRHQTSTLASFSPVVITTLRDFFCSKGTL